MLKEVQCPDGSVVSFAYDAFGRRIEKKISKTITRFLWDGNVPLHEWKEFDYKETTDNDRITWVFQGFTPVAKIQGDKSYSIISDHLGTPLQAIDTQGNKVWERELDIYGRIRKEKGEKGFCCFLYQGQYFDSETDLCYNRYRYYSPDTGTYISQDPIGLAGGNPTLYAFVKNVNIEVDIFGLFKAVKKRVLSDGRIREYSKEVPSTTLGPTRGAAMVKETSPTGKTRMWMESYNHNGEVIRVHPKAIDGKPINLPHYPPTYKDIQEGKAIETSDGKGKKVQCQKK